MAKDRDRREYWRHYKEKNKTWINYLTRIKYHSNPEPKKADFKEKYNNDPAFRQEVSNRVAKWRKENKERSDRNKKESHLKRSYNITLERLEEMKAAQKGRCAICNKAKKLVVDHCHATNNVRELLCHRCNIGLGFIEDSAWLELAMSYERRWDEYFESQ